MTDNELQLHRDLGRLEGEVSGLQSQVATMQSGQEQMQEKIEVIHDALMQAKGGWRLIFLAGSLAAMLGGLAASFLGVFRRWA